MGSIAVDITPGAEYKLGRGGREAVRLTAQHHTLVNRQGYLLHPTIAASIKDIRRPRIADVASGTGIWAIDMARAMPCADVVALDISDAQYPPAWAAPSNVSFELDDLLQETPDHLRGTFDVVHVRLLLAAGPAVDKTVFIERFRSLLRPGGWLQWEELAYPNMIACFPSMTGTSVEIDTLPLDDHPAVLAMNKYLHLGDRVGWTDNFVSVMTAAGGYDHLKLDSPALRPELIQRETDLNLVVVTDYLGCFVQNKGKADPAVVCDVQSAVARLQTDVENGVLLAYRWNVGLAMRCA